MQASARVQSLTHQDSSLLCPHECALPSSPQGVDADSQLSTVISGIILSLVPGFLLARIDGKVLMVASMVMSLAGPILLAVIDIRAPYWYVPAYLPLAPN